MIEVTENNIVDLLLDDDRLRSIIEVYKNETGSNLVFRNTISELSARVPLNLDLVKSLKNNLFKCGQEGEEIFEGFIFNGDFPHEMLFEFLEERKFITVLAHRRGPIELLLNIARLENPPSEALLTAGQFYYDSSEISPNKFSSFLKEFSNQEVLFISLARYINKKDEKSLIFRDFVSGSEKILRLHEKVLISYKLKTTKDLPLIIEKFNTKVPMFLRSISKNKFTPVEILESLTEISNIKYASTIRFNARTRLNEKTKT